jgi:pyridoxamine 5'-phosphate oxidase
MVDYAKPLLEQDVAADPFEQFGRWIAQAAEVIRVPGAAALATASPTGRPSVRMVLVSAWSADGFCFHSNYESRKGVELLANPSAALLFYWDALGRQVRAEGVVERLSREESDAYFATRPREARIGAHVSRQSAPVESRAALDAQVRAATATFAGSDVPRPDWWGGYRLLPESFEMWQHREDRLHDRLFYRRIRKSEKLAAGDPQPHGGWQLRRLQP